jgi:multicomponent Na+:H+ antiporter subunit G
MLSELITSALLLAGTAFIVVGAIGVFRLPDVLCRGHAAAKALTLGIFLMLLALWADLRDTQSGLKVMLTIFFQVVTIPIASHLVGLLALKKNLPRWKHRPMDDHRRPPQTTAR